MTQPERPRITVMGSFIADLMFRTAKIPANGETVLGNGFRIGPGGKGSNQAVAAARLGAATTFICRLGRDSFGEMARETYAAEGIDSSFCFDDDEAPTGAASIIIDDATGANSIVVVPGSGFLLSQNDVSNAVDSILNASVFITQFEIPLPTAAHALSTAFRAGVYTILNPAPAHPIDPTVLKSSRCVTPNEVEASMLTGIRIESLPDAERAARKLHNLGAENVVITLGANGAFAFNTSCSEHIPAVNAGPVVDTTGAGDAFNGGFAVAMAEGEGLLEAARFGCTVAGISVTRHGTSTAMPYRREVDALLG